MKHRYFVFSRVKQLRPYCLDRGIVYMLRPDNDWISTPYTSVESLSNSWNQLIEVDAKYMKLHYRTKE